MKTLRSGHLKFYLDTAYTRGVLPMFYLKLVSIYKRLQRAGALRRRLHPAHLHPRHPPDAGPGGGNHGPLHVAGTVKATQQPQKIPGGKVKLPARCSLTLSAHFDVWVTVWVRSVDPHFDPHKIQQKQNKNSRNQAISGVSWSCYPDLNWGPHPYQQPN